MRSAVLILALWAALSAPQDIGWLKLDQAKVISSHTGKLILVYVACDPKSGLAICNGGVAERAFADPLVLKRQDDFHYVRICEKKTAQAVKATKPPEAIFMDSDGDEIFRSAFNDGVSLDKSMSSALQRYAPQDVRWSRDIPTTTTGGKSLVVVGFDDEKAETLKAFEDKSLVKFHDRIEFVRLPFKKDSDLAKKWGVTQTPALFLCDASKEASEKNALDRLTGKKTPVALKASIVKALAKLEPKK